MLRLRLTALAVFFFAVSAAMAQNASVSGTVTDPSGAAITGAAITALHVDTGVTSSTTTNTAGLFVFPSLPPGAYTLSAEQPGFRKAAVEKVMLDIGSQVTVDIGLQVGQAAESVEVSAAATTLNATSATIG